jgi:hypothetical protein
MEKLETLRRVIGGHLAEIASLLTPDYKLTFVARVPGQHAMTIIVSEEEDFDPVVGELISSVDLLTVRPPEVKS